jgi:hypothetical protein
MFSMWMRLASQSTLLALESQRVIARRMVVIAAGNSRAKAEARRMIREKVFAAIRVSAMLAVGKPPTSAIRHYRSRVRANERRLSKS